MTKSIPLPRAARLQFECFTGDDAPALAEILADPEITRNITANGSTPDRCAVSAVKRIAWHNASWAERGYGVWALKAGPGLPVSPGQLVGWCGFAAPDVPGDEPEILYGLARSCWGRGLGTEAASAAAAWLFENTDYQGYSALVFGRLNPGSCKIAGKLGMSLRGSMAFRDFLSDVGLARDVLDYEVWRLAEGICAAPDKLLFQAPYKAGQITATGVAPPDAVAARLSAAALARPDFADYEPAQLSQRVGESFRTGLAEAHVDWYHLSKSAWRQGGCAG